MLAWATENAVAGHMWPAGCYLPTTVLSDTSLMHTCEIKILLNLPLRYH